MSYITSWNYPVAGTVRPGYSHRSIGVVPQVPTASAVHLSYSITVNHDQLVENLSIFPETVTANIWTEPKADLLDNGSTDVFGTAAFKSLNGSFGSYDGTTDYGGSSGGELTYNEIISETISLTPTQVSLFTGTGTVSIGAWCDSFVIYNLSTGHSGQTGLSAVNADTYQGTWTCTIFP